MSDPFFCPYCGKPPEINLNSGKPVPCFTHFSVCFRWCVPKSDTTVHQCKYVKKSFHFPLIASGLLLDSQRFTKKQGTLARRTLLQIFSEFCFPVTFSSFYLIFSSNSFSLFLHCFSVLLWRLPFSGLI